MSKRLKKIIKHYEAVAPVYRRAHGGIMQSFYPVNMEEFLMKVGNDLKLYSTKHLIDLGSGYGTVANYMANTFECLVFGMELVKSIYEKSIMYSNLNPRIYFECTDFEKEIAKMSHNEPTDAILMLETFGYVSKPKKFLANCFGTLNPGGRMAIKSYRVANPELPYIENGKDFFGYKLYEDTKILTWATEAGFKIISNQDLDHLQSLQFDSESLYTEAGIPAEKWARFTQVPIPFLIILEK